MQVNKTNIFAGIGFVCLAIYISISGALTVPGGGVRIEIGNAKYFIGASLLYIGWLILREEYRKWNES